MRAAISSLPRARFLVLSLALIASSGLAACGSDSVPTETPSSTKAASTAPIFDPVGYCNASLAIEVAPEPDIDFATATAEQMATGLKAYATDMMLPLLEDVAKVAPPELGDALSTFRTQFQKLADTGDPSVFGDPGFAAAEADAHTFDLATCNWNTVNVKLLDYAFGGAPSSLPAGVVNIEVTNAGKELHELAVLRRNDGVTQSFRDILQLPQDEAQELVSQAGALQGAVEPSGSDYVVADLKPGTYAFVCFLPKGSTSPEAMDQAPSYAPPHAMLGMVHDFTVA